MYGPYIAMHCMVLMVRDRPGIQAIIVDKKILTLILIVAQQTFAFKI